jgi:hypothetical protein
MDPDKLPIDELIRWVRHFGVRPSLYIQPADVPNASNFLGGVRLAATALVGPLDREELDAIVTARGWHVAREGRPVPIEQQMQEIGMTDREIIAELAELEAIILERQAEAMR